MVTKGNIEIEKKVCNCYKKNLLKTAFLTCAINVFREKKITQLII